MTLKRLLLGIVIVFVGIWITDFIVHGVLLKNIYVETAHLWRPEAEMRGKLGWMVLGQFVMAVVFVTIWAIGFADKASPGAAVVYGVCAGLFYGANTLITYAVQDIPGSLIFKWIVAGTIQSTLLALLLFAISRRRSVESARSL